MAGGPCPAAPRGARCREELSQRGWSWLWKGCGLGLGLARFLFLCRFLAPLFQNCPRFSFAGLVWEICVRNAWDFL